MSVLHAHQAEEREQHAATALRESLKYTLIIGVVVCVCVLLCVRVYACVCVHMFIMRVRESTCVHVCEYLCVCVCVCSCVCTSSRMRTRIFHCFRMHMHPGTGERFE